MFISQKMEIRPILKSISTSFMFNKKNCEMGKKNYPLRGGRGNGGTVQISSWKCNFSIYLDINVYYLDIQAITTLLAFYCFFMCWFLLFIHFSILQPLSWKITFSGIQKPTPPSFQPTGIGHGFIVKRKWVRITNYLGLPINLILFFILFLKLCILQKKKL